MHLDAFDAGEQLLVERLNVAVVGDVLGGNGHLPTAHARADVRHAVVVADGLVLVVGIARAPAWRTTLSRAWPRRRGISRAAARGRDHLVAVERQHAVAAERAQHLSAETRAEALGGILDHGMPYLSATSIMRSMR